MRIIKIFFATIILFMGLQFFSMGTIMYNDIKSEIDETFKIVAVIDNIYDEQVFVSYNVNGVEYSSELNAYNSDFYNGQEIEIYYDEDNPENIAYADSSEFTFLLIFPAIGCIMVVTSIFSIACDIRKIKIYNSIHKKGELVEAFYKSTIKKGFFSYVIICEWPSESGRVFTFKSKPLLWNPETVILQNNVKTFKVKISKKNINHYYVDVKYITDLEIERNRKMVNNQEFADEINRLNNTDFYAEDTSYTKSKYDSNNNDEGAIKYKK